LEQAVLVVLHKQATILMEQAEALETTLLLAGG
jgi:hypothetical protein